MNPYDPIFKVFLAAAGIKSGEVQQPEKKEKAVEWKEAGPEMKQFVAPAESVGQRVVKHYY